MKQVTQTKTKMLQNDIFSKNMQQLENEIMGVTN